MDVLEAIRTRRTTKSFSGKPVPRDLIEQVLEAAVWAPNHRLTEPWEFIVVQGDGIDRLGQLRRQMTVEYLHSKQQNAGAAQSAGPAGPALERQISLQGDDAYRKATAAPVTVAVCVTQHLDPAVREEDYAAGVAAIQNLMLAAHGLGLASFWSTNNLVKYGPALEFLGVHPDHRVIGLVQLGYAAGERSQRRAPAASRTRWLG